MFAESGVLLSRVTDQLSCELNGEIAILNLKSKLYFGLTDVGAFIWTLLEAPTDKAALRQAVAEEFDVDAVQCAADVESFLQDLDKAGLLQIERQAGSAG